MKTKGKTLDLYKAHKAEYVTPKKPTLIQTKPAKYLTIAGQGAPGGEAFQESVGALYSVAFTLKMAKKFAGNDYKVCHLEGLWWGDKEGEDFAAQPPETWNWKLIIRVPDFIAAKDVKETIATLKEKGKPQKTADVKLETIDEGQCVQMLHLGPYKTEGETISQMIALAQEKGLSCCGRHHEIYLSDPRRVPAERLRTILRLPVAP
jgi:hypothetical protein